MHSLIDLGLISLKYAEENYMSLSDSGAIINTARTTAEI
jgi:hypothetical protein